MSWRLSAFSDEAGPSCDDQIKGLQRAGLKYIDIRSVEGFNIAALPSDKAKEVRKKLDAAGIIVSMFGSPLGKIDLADDINTDLDKLRHMGVLAPVLGCNAVRIFSYYNRKGKLSHSEFESQSIQRLKQLKKLAKELKLVLYHENESDIFGDKCVDVVKIASQLRDDTFRTIFDPGNFNAGREDAWECWLKLRDMTDGLHLKDNAWSGDGTMHHVPVGQGQGELKRILADAVQRGWQGPVAVEPHLQHSAAVAATGPSGVANQAYSKMSSSESFHIACTTAKDLIQSVGGKIA